MKFILCVLAACLCVLTARAEENKFNKLVDEIIWEMEQDMINASKTQLDLPEIDQKFSKEVLFFTVDGSVKISGAHVGNLSTIHRVGDMVPVEDDNSGSLILSGTFSMSDLTVHADLFDFKMSIVHVHDPLTLVIGKNAASFKVTMTFDENMQCKTTLDSATVSQFGDFKIDLGYTGVMADIEDDLANYVMNKLSSTIQQVINSHVFPMVDNAIQKMDLCSKLL